MGQGDEGQVGGEKVLYKKLLNLLIYIYFYIHILKVAKYKNVRGKKIII